MNVWAIFVYIEKYQSLFTYRTTMAYHIADTLINTVTKPTSNTNFLKKIYKFLDEFERLVKAF